MNLPVPAGVDTTGYRLGPPQRAGALTMVPVFGPAYPGIAPPRSGLKLSRVVTYGQVELTNPATAGVAIVPLHVGYIQDSAQNHALCRSGFIAAGQTLRFDDACCVQESQGGYLAERDQWFFVLPVELRPAALRLRGTSQYSKLWGDIASFNARHGLPARGHLEQVLTRKRAVLTQYQSRLELLDGQLGALFFVGDRLAGVEIAPDPVYFAEVWMALVCFAYGPAAWFAETGAPEESVEAFEADSLDEVRAALQQRRRSVADEVGQWLARAAWQPGDLVEEERYLDLRLSTVVAETAGGQVVTDGSRLVYASLFAAAV
ncbi:ARPP-1 family domain-containing protein [Dactylosporangium cerinum]|uniref:ARPP-1 family domain-containing protein n=1 Tax=Dactylosporangium cerinum TaxID=1434730 RepID=A0ABV9WIC1_9ACTN